jgi:hypothetical protein
MIKARRNRALPWRTATTREAVHIIRRRFPCNEVQHPLFGMYRNDDVNGYSPAYGTASNAWLVLTH